MSGYWTLPAGWEWRSMEEVAVIGRIKGKAQGELFYSLAGDPWRQPELQPAPPDAQPCDESCVLVGKSQKQLKVVVPAGAGVASRNWVVLRPTAGLDREFVAWYLRAFARFVTTATWAGAIAAQRLKQLQVPMPVGRDAEEAQRRIVHQLGRQMREWQEAQRLAGQLQRDADTLVAAAIHEIFTAEAAAHWPATTLGEVADFVRGPSKKISQDPDHPRFVEIGAMSQARKRARGIAWDELGGWDPARTADPDRYLLREHDILLERAAHSTGRVFRLTGHVPPAVSSVSAFRLRCRQQGDHQSFLYWLMRSPAVLREVNARKRNKSTTLYSVAGRDFRSIPVRIPPRDEQERLARYLDGMEEQALQMAERQLEAARLLEQLVSALYRAAFVETEA